MALKDESDIREALEEVESVLEKGKNPNQEFARGQKNALYWVLGEMEL